LGGRSRSAGAPVATPAGPLAFATIVDITAHITSNGSSARAGAGEITPRAHARTIGTEFGVAELPRRSLRERAKALISIAHPDFRDELAAQARRTHEL
jgi:hypothetical protein